MVSHKDGCCKPGLSGAALSQRGSGKSRALNVWFNFVPGVVGVVWHTGLVDIQINGTTHLWENMHRLEPQAGTESYVKFAQNSIKPDSRDFLPQARGLPLVPTHCAIGNIKSHCSWMFLEILLFTPRLYLTAWCDNLGDLKIPFQCCNFMNNSNN